MEDRKEAAIEIAESIQRLEAMVRQHDDPLMRAELTRLMAAVNRYTAALS